ncbi:hypothetical protein OUZ56_009871 [Daphnia magna]|uniref:Uncharacterized protein n=1 Tax=Daphnia magna TaxID=35525 RepID=A0ABR0AHI4_9CRUS|nr:hypothetical protein OUZ56_009871 [Daphnia magna]
MFARLPKNIALKEILSVDMNFALGMASSSFPNLISTTPNDLAFRRDRQQRNNTIYLFYRLRYIQIRLLILISIKPVTHFWTIPHHSIYVWAWFSTTGGVGSICRVDNFPSKIIEVFSDEFGPEFLAEFKIVNVTWMEKHHASRTHCRSGSVAKIMLRQIRGRKVSEMFGHFESYIIAYLRFNWYVLLHHCGSSLRLHKL